MSCSLFCFVAALTETTGGTGGSSCICGFSLRPKGKLSHLRSQHYDVSSLTNSSGAMLIQAM